MTDRKSATDSKEHKHTEYPIEETPAQKKRFFRVSRKAALGTLVVILLLGGMGGAQYALANMYHDRILAHISIAGVDVSGLNKTEATEKVQEVLNHFLDQGVIVTFGDDTKTIPLTARGASDPDVVYELVEFDVTAAVDQAYTIGRSGPGIWQFTAPMWYTIAGRENLTPTMSLSETRIAEAMREAFAQTESPGTPTDFVVTIPEQKNTDIDIRVVEAVTGTVLNIDDALKTLEKDAQDLKLHSITLQLIEQTSSISVQEAETLIPKVRQAIAKAPYELTFTNETGKTFSYPITQKELAIWVKPEKDDNGNLHLGLDTEAMSALFTDIHTDIDIAPQDASFKVEGDRVVEFIPSLNGLIVNDEQILEDLSTQFANSETATPIMITVDRTAPTISTESVNSYGIKEVLGVGTSNFSGSPSNRRKNIAHGAEKLNGILVPPGETLSLLEKLRPFTVADGYLPELVIKGDEIIPEVGGGLCQIGTTTFRAAMNSGLHIIERRNHSLVVSYYNDPSNGNPGTDATIYDPAPDLKIQNDTGNYMMLTTEVDQETSTLTFTFWGTSDGRKGWYTPPQVLSWTGYGAKVMKETTSIPVGTTKCQAAHPGATTTFDYHVAKADGTIITETFNSSYRSLPTICLVGVEKVSEDSSDSSSTDETDTTTDSEKDSENPTNTDEETDLIE